MNRYSRYIGMLCSLVLLLLASVGAQAQTRVGYVASQVIRERFPEAIQVNQRIEAIVNEWKKELEEKQRIIDELQNEIQKKRLIWGDAERKEKEEQLNKLRQEREVYAKQKFGPDGEFDKMVADMYRPIEEKIYVAIQDVSQSDGYDIIWDKSTQPLVFVNARYDITVKVMERLGIPVEDLKAQQEEAVKNDPRNNQEKESPSKRRSRARTRDKNEDTATPPKEIPQDGEIPR